jgi:hypothetical protein
MTNTNVGSRRCATAGDLLRVLQLARPRPTSPIRRIVPTTVESAVWRAERCAMRSVRVAMTRLTSSVARMEPHTGIDHSSARSSHDVSADGRNCAPPDAASAPKPVSPGIEHHADQQPRTDDELAPRRGP